MTVHYLLHGYNTTGGTSFVTASISPNAARRTLLVLQTLPDNPAVVPTISGARATWTRKVTSPDPLGTADPKFYVFYGTGAATAEAVTVNFGSGNDQLAINYWFVDLEGYTTDPVVQAVFATSTGGGSPASATLAAFASGSNHTFAIGYVSDTDSILAAGSGFTALQPAPVNGWYDAGLLHSQWVAAADTSVDFSWTVVSANDWDIIAFELAVAGGSPVAPKASNHYRQRRAA